MAYIESLDPSYHDPRLDFPHLCVFCGKKGTVEDFTEVHDVHRPDMTGLQCPWCDGITWDWKENE